MVRLIVTCIRSLCYLFHALVVARLRLAVLRPEKSLELLEETITLHPSNVSAHILLSTVQLARKELKPARRTLEKVFAFQRNDVYSHTLLGNIWLELARKAGSSEDVRVFYQHDERWTS